MKRTSIKFRMMSGLRTATLSSLIFLFWAGTTFSFTAEAQKVEPIKYGDFNSWLTRDISESKVIGGKTKRLYEIGPKAGLTGNKPYHNAGGSPWATSNVYAKVSGIAKGSNAVFPAEHPGAGKCVKMTSGMETVRVLGIINMDVMVAGSIFLGEMLEPISNTKNPYSKMECGVPYTQRPQALVYDYKVEMPAVNSRIKSSGFGKKTTLPGHDTPVTFVLLQHRWEDSEGNLHATRVASGAEKFHKGSQWVTGHKLPLVYGDPVGKSGIDTSLTGLRKGNNAYWSRNSKGKMVPVNEEGFDANATPTHVILMMSAGAGEPYVGTEGLTYYVDNVAFQL